MSNSELQQFAQQLSVWTDLIIENGRTPFRRVDLYPQIQSDQGILHPPLVFWINRQSMMAGGILLLPQEDLETELKVGHSCCDALGLKHFVTWENDQVRIWHLNDDKIEQYQQFILENPDHPDSFRHLLGEVLETLKLLAVIGLVPPNELSAHYLHNLFQTALDLALPAQINSYRSQRAEEALNTAEDADQLAGEANRLLLLQLLGLAWHQQLPSAILPEKLERAIQISLPQLPEQLKAALALKVSKAAPELPLEAAVCFHHLLLRLRQLTWRQSEPRAIDSIRLLIESWQPNRVPTQSLAEVQLYPQSPLLGQEVRQVLSDSPSLLAAVGLLENLLREAPTDLLYGNAFMLDLHDRVDLSIWAQLDKQRTLSREERQQYLALFRTSWPNRRFRISGDKPLWHWELIHLLGLAKNQRQLKLILPSTALKLPIEDPLWPLLQDHYSIEQISHLEQDAIELELKPGPQQAGSIKIIRATQTRDLVPATNLAIFRQQLLLTLQLPDELFQLLETKLTWAAEEKLSEKAVAGLHIYLQSDLWMLFSQLLGIDQESVLESPEEYGVPRPDLLHLIELGRLAEATVKETPLDVNKLLMELLQSPEIDNIQFPAQRKTATHQSNRLLDKELQKELLHELQREGIPTFPEQYLYFLEQPEMTGYQLSPPLTVKSELLGQVELEDADGQTFQVYGEELVSALLLCSQLGKTDVELPTDRNQLALLQQHYWQDIKQLHKHLSSLCHSRLQNPKSADKLTKKLWKKLNLPKLR